MTKKHCDVCDNITDVKDTDDIRVRIDGPHNMLHDITLDVRFQPFYPNSSESGRKELCIDCRRNAYKALFIKHGGKVGA